MTQIWARPARTGAVTDPRAILPFVTTMWLLIMVVVVLGALTTGVALGVGWLVATDRSVANWGYHLTYGHAGLTTWWLGVAKYGAPWVQRLVLLGLAGVQVWRRRWDLAVWLVGVSVAENIVAPLAKFLLRRPRPQWTNPITVEHGLSYPSGHATAGGMFVTIVLLLAMVAVRSRTMRAALVAVGVAVWLVVSMDRIFLGVHYLSDVVAGNLLGAALVLLGWLCLLWWHRRTDPPRRP